MKARQELFWLIGLSALLAIFGGLNLVSALSLWGEGVHLRLLYQHLVWVGLGFGISWLVFRLDEGLLERFAVRWHLVALGGIGLVLLIGRAVGGNRNWLGFGGFGIQPSEFAKLTTIVVLAAFVAEQVVPGGYRWRDLRTPLWLLGAPVLGVFLQGDLGTMLLLCCIGGTMLAVARVRWTVWVTVLLLGAATSAGLYQLRLTDAQRARITTFLHPEADPRGRGYHVLQARIAIGSGGAWGRGFLQGRMNKLRYLPEQHTDFVFPVLAEEWGFAGSALVLVLYALLLAALLGIAQSAENRFGSLLAVGVAGCFFWQLAINIGGVLGVLPLTGVTLPFFSYGGSSTLTTYAMLGLVAGVARRRQLFGK